MPLALNVADGDINAVKEARKEEVICTSLEKTVQRRTNSRVQEYFKGLVYIHMRSWHVSQPTNA